MNQNQIISVYPYTEYPYHVGLKIPLTDIERLLEVEGWIVNNCGPIGPIHNPSTRWFLSYAIEDQVTFGFRDKDTAFKFKMTFQ